MNGKKAKLIRKEARKLYRKNMAKNAEEIGKLIGNNLKPKPKWIPWKVWLWLISFFIVYKK